MSVLSDITECFTEQSRKILEDNLVGIYLHGSAAMECFNEKKSDIDLLVVVKNAVPDEIKRRYMDMIVELNAFAPKKGLELSVVRKEVCKPFVYPTPYELHFSAAYLEWYKKDPLDYIARMNGLDKDLAAHFTIIKHRGKCLFGEKIEGIFGSIDKEYYFDSIWSDIENAKEDIVKDPTYIVLNLCRVLAYKEEGLILSKQEGGNWGLDNVPKEHHPLILWALENYTSCEPLERNLDGAYEYAAYLYAWYMIDKIKS